MKLESVVQREIQLALGSRPDTRVFRVNSGKWFHVDRPCPACREHGRWITGAPAGTADLLGVHGPAGRFLAVEVKSDSGVQSDQQKRFQEAVEVRGGLYVVARSASEAEAALR